MQVVSEYKFGCDAHRCFVVTEYFMEEDGERTAIKTPLYEEVTDETDISLYPDYIQKQIVAFKN